MKEQLTIINNEKCEKILENIYCQNLEMKSLPESLATYFDISLILRESKISKLHQLNVKNIKLSSNILNFIISIFKEFKNKKKKIFNYSNYTLYIFSLSSFNFRKKKNIFIPKKQRFRGMELNIWKIFCLDISTYAKFDV